MIGRAEDAMGDHSPFCRAGSGRLLLEREAASVGPVVARRDSIPLAARIGIAPRRALDRDAAAGSWNHSGMHRCGADRGIARIEVRSPDTPLDIRRATLAVDRLANDHNLGVTTRNRLGNVRSKREA